MVLPISDDNSDRQTVPFVTYAIIAISMLVFVTFQRLGENVRFTYTYATVPAEIVRGKDIVTGDRAVVDPLVQFRPLHAPGQQPTPISVYLTLLTSMFMHGGILHILGNMWFLWIFGDNVEDAFGHVRYAAFYLLTGVIASLCHVAMNMSGPESLEPTLGASGAISGVMGAYLVLYPKRQVKVLVLRVMATVPGYVAVGLWFLFQIVSMSGILGSGANNDHVAHAAHIGGLLAGAALAKPFAWGRRLTQPVTNSTR